MKELGKISDFCEVIAGQSPDGKAYNTDGKGIEFHQGKKAFGIKILEESGVWTTTVTKLAEAGDILMSVRAPVGPTNITNRKVCIGRGLAAIRCGENILPSFVLYALKNIEKKIIGNVGAVFNSINKKMIENIPIPIANINEQRRIVSYLDSSFKLIDEIKDKALKSLTEAKALFQSALAEAMEPKEGWEEKTLGEIAKDSADGPFGSNLKKEHYTSKREVRIIQLSNIGENGWREENTKYTTYKHLNTISRSEVHPGDIVIAKMMPAGRAILCPEKEKKYVLSSDAVKIVLKKGYYNRYFLYSINSEYFRIQVYENVSGSGRVRTSLTKLRNCIVRIPPLPTQKLIVSHLDKLSSKVRAIEEKYQKMVEECDALKQAMLRDVFE